MNHKQMVEKLEDLERRIRILERACHSHPTPPITTQPATIWPRGCSRCGLGSSGQPMGYVCNDPLCPTAITALNSQDIFK